ncbi:hypothetical protein [Brachybacterium hainanense]|uniref:Uncharacterized protein n=1 Tax=Brachybacterium hainanense TaxID=1541174 RepID=A0ABV6RFE8_9MICO
MRFTTSAADGGSWTELLASRTDFDGHPPLDRLRLFWPLASGSPDRDAVALSLIFSPWVAGRSEHPAPFSALTEQRIVEWFQSQRIWASAGPVRIGGLPLPRGTRRLLLSGSPSSEREVLLRLVPSTEGGMVQEQEVHVATNAGTLIAHAPDATSAFSMRLGVAVLLAESLSITEIVDPEFAASAPEQFRAAARLVECVALGLRSA